MNTSSRGVPVRSAISRRVAREREPAGIDRASPICGPDNGSDLARSGELDRARDEATVARRRGGLIRPGAKCSAPAPVFKKKKNHPPPRTGAPMPRKLAVVLDDVAVADQKGGVRSAISAEALSAISGPIPFGSPIEMGNAQR